MTTPQGAQYRDLGPTQLLTATPDTTNRNLAQVPLVNAGSPPIRNWTITATPQDLNCKVALAEVYQISLDGPVGSLVSVYRNGRLWNKVVQGWANNYDPINPLYIRPGDSIFLFWNADSARWTPTPTAVFWLRYDINLPENTYPGVS